MNDTVTPYQALQFIFVCISRNICAGQESMPNLENAILGEVPENTTWITTNKLDG